MLEIYLTLFHIIGKKSIHKKSQNLLLFYCIKALIYARGFLYLSQKLFSGERLKVKIFRFLVSIEHVNSKF